MQSRVGPFAGHMNGSVENVNFLKAQCGFLHNKPAQRCLADREFHHITNCHRRAEHHQPQNLLQNPLWTALFYKNMKQCLERTDINVARTLVWNASVNSAMDTLLAAMSGDRALPADTVIKMLIDIICWVVTLSIWPLSRHYCGLLMLLDKTF